MAVPDEPGSGGRRILSIASAPGWGALYEREPDDEDEFPFLEPKLVTLAAWALVEENGTTRLVGLVQHPASDDVAPGMFSFADEPVGFAGYSNQGLKTKPAELY
jgi:hypothetical protein